MKSNLAFLAATITAGCGLVFSASNAQELPTVLHFVWRESTKLTYDPLLVATFILAATLAVGRSIDILRETLPVLVDQAAVDPQKIAADTHNNIKVPYDIATVDTTASIPVPILETVFGRSSPPTGSSQTSARIIKLIEVFRCQV